MAFDVLSMAVSGICRGTWGLEALRVVAHRVWKPPRLADSRLYGWLLGPLPLVLVAAAWYYRRKLEAWALPVLALHSAGWEGVAAGGWRMLE